MIMVIQINPGKFKAMINSSNATQMHINIKLTTISNMIVNNQLIDYINYVHDLGYQLNESVSSYYDNIKKIHQQVFLILSTN